MHVVSLVNLLVLAFTVPTVALRLAEKGQDKRTVLLMQGDRADHHLKYMYEPPMTSLRLGFENSPHDLNLINPPAAKLQVIEKKLKGYISQLKSGDMLVWLGLSGSRLLSNGTIHFEEESSEMNTSTSLFMSDSTLFDFPSLRARGVKLVYFQSEPQNICTMTDQVDEMWDFSWHNIENCKKQKNAPVQRYTPLASYATAVITQKENAGALTFFGSAVKRPCWSKLKKVLGNQLEEVYDAWDEKAYKKVLDNHGIFLNLHKGCQGDDKKDSNAPITWRSPKLLNAHGIIISQHAHPLDAKEYEGLIDFVDFEDIPSAYQALAKMSATERQQIADKRAQEFSKRFHPRKVFERAGIYDLMRP